MKWLSVDLLALAFVVGLGLLFYLPETNSLESRYMYYPDCFERAATCVNPDYAGQRFRTAAEGMRPLMTLLARPALMVFHRDLAAAVTALYLGVALIAAVLTYIANRLYFSPVLSLYITVLLLFDRCLMPVARGLGMMGVLLLVPLMLVFIRSLAHTQDRSLSGRRKAIPIVLMAASGGVILLLGGHETMYALAFAIGSAGLWGIVWIVQSIRARTRMPGPTWSTLMGLAAVASVALMLVAVLWWGIPDEQRKGSYWSVVFQRHYQSSAAYDVKQEMNIAAPRLQQWKSTFWDGKYPTEYGSWHSNTFLVPGPGFNGIIPICVLPGLLVGLWWWIREIVSLFRSPPANTVERFHRYLVTLFTVCLGVFVAVAMISSDPKPTRYSPCIFAFFALSAVGYRQMFGWLQRKTGGDERNVTQAPGAQPLSIARCVPFVLAAAVTLSLGSRIYKNFQDLQSYFGRYRFEITTYGFPVLVEKALREHADEKVYFVARRWLGPDIGLVLGYTEPANLTFLSRAVFDRANVQRIVPDEAIVFMREDQGDESEWSCGRAAGFKKK